MNRLFLIAIALLCIPAFSKPIQACECRAYGTPICALFWRSDAVFVGRVVDMKPMKVRPDDVYTYDTIHFVLEESFRGVSGRRVSVGVATNTLCDPKFKMGKRYLVYAGLDDKTNQFFTGMCSGTGLIGYDEDLTELRKLRQRQADESISGRIVTHRYRGLPGMSIEVIGDGKSSKTMTTKYGDFSVPLPGPGSYTVRVSVPYTAQLVDASDDDVTVRSTTTESVSTFEYAVRLEKSQCSYLQLDLDGIDPRATATVAGNVLTASDQPVDTGAVTLVNTVDTGQDYVALLNKAGSFRFEGVSPGEYYVVLNAGRDVPEAFDAPYAQTFYPATEDKREAKTIQVTEHGVVENLTMHVGQRMSERKVAGRAVWKSGRLPEDPHLRVYSGDKYVRRVEIEDNGTFKFTLYGDFDYSIEAIDYIDEIEGRSQRLKMPRRDSAGYKLVIQRLKH